MGWCICKRTLLFSHKSWVDRQATKLLSPLCCLHFLYFFAFQLMKNYLSSARASTSSLFFAALDRWYFQPLFSRVFCCRAGLAEVYDCHSWNGCKRQGKLKWREQRCTLWWESRQRRFDPGRSRRGWGWYQALKKGKGLNIPFKEIIIFSFSSFENPSEKRIF